MAFYEPGVYACTIRDQGFDVSPEKRTPFFWLSFVPETFNGQQVDVQYERITKLWLTKKTVNRVTEILRGLGWQGSSFRDLEPDGHYSFAGVGVSLECTHNQNGDTVYENWGFLAPGPQVQHTSGVAKKLDALYSKVIRNDASAVPAETIPTPDVAGSEEVESINDDEIPF